MTQLEIRSRVPFAEGAAFGDAGPYERIDGLIRFAVDPLHPANEAIVDLHLAPRDADGRVGFEADFCLLQPADPGRGSGRLLLDVANRGRKRAVAVFNRAPAQAVPTERIDPGDGFLMRRGWSVAWCGWQWDVVRSPALIGLEPPQAIAVNSPEPIQGQVLVEFQPTDRERDRLLADRIHRPYPAADVDDPDATLTVRDWWDGPRTVVPRDQWHFARDEGGTPVPDETRVWTRGGFDPGRIYEVTYQTRTCPVVGTGLLAVRDTVSFLRHGRAGNPAAGRMRHTYAFGQSQSGRFLRHLIALGLNMDEAGRQVFDGVLAHVAGGRRGEFNHRFAQPSVMSSRGFGHLPPFADAPQTDPLTGQTAGLLDRQRALGGVPKIVYTNTSAEYWRGDGSLVHTALAGEQDVDPPAGVRVYHFAGTQHVSGTLPPVRVGPDGARGANGSNVVDYSPLPRAALINLDRWVAEGVDPPPSVVPRLADGTAVRPAEALTAFPKIPDAAVPDPDRLRPMVRVDLGPDTARGVGQFPAKTGEAYPFLVAAIDGDGNEVAGLRPPEVEVPIGTHTGWNPRAADAGGAGQILEMLGSSFPFARTAEDRARIGDPRPSLAERYRDRDDYLARVRAAAERLVTGRYLLPEDVDVAVASAADRWDAFSRA